VQFDVDTSGERLDIWLTKHLPKDNQGKKHSRTTIQRMIQSGRVTLNHKPCTVKNHVLTKGEQLVIDNSPLLHANVSEPFDLNERIVYEDDALVVVNKPAGVVVHPGTLKEQGTLAEVLLRRDLEKEGDNEQDTDTTIPKQKVNKDGVRYFQMLDSKGKKHKLYVVQRLDKDTSGVLIVAKTVAARNSLVEQLKNRTLKREYLSICFGTWKERSGTIKTLIGRDPLDRQKMKVFEEDADTTDMGKFVLMLVRRWRVEGIPMI